jgi:hypothetical protein
MGKSTRRRSESSDSDYSSDQSAHFAARDESASSPARPKNKKKKPKTGSKTRGSSSVSSSFSSSSSSSQHGSRKSRYVERITKENRNVLPHDVLGALVAACEAADTFIDTQRTDKHDTYARKVLIPAIEKALCDEPDDYVDDLLKKNVRAALLACKEDTDVVIIQAYCAKIIDGVEKDLKSKGPHTSNTFAAALEEGKRLAKEKATKTGCNEVLLNAILLYANMRAHCLEHLKPGDPGYGCEPHNSAEKGSTLIQVRCQCFHVVFVCVCVCGVCVCVRVLSVRSHNK